MDKSLMNPASYPQAGVNDNSLKCLLKQEKNEQTTFSGGGIGNGGSSVTTRSQRAAAASKSNESMPGRREQIEGSGVACIYRAHHQHYQQNVVKSEPCTNMANSDNGKVLCLPLHQTTPDTTGSPEGHPEFSLKRPAEDVDNSEVHPQGGGSSPNPVLRPRNKRPRRMYTTDQVQVLEKMFMNNEYPTAQDRVLLSAVTQLSTEKVKVWFQNRRSRERRRRQNQLHNNATMKRIGMAPVANPKPPPCFNLSHPAVTASPHGLTLPKNFTLTHPSTTRAITPPSAPTQQQLAQAFGQTANCAFSHQMQADINNNNNASNNNNNMSMGVAQPNQFMRPAMGSKHPFSNMYAKLCPSSVQPVAAAAAAASSMDTKDSVGPMHVPKSADSYTPLVPAWSQSWPMFPAAPQNGPQLQKMMPMDDFCDNSNRWGDTPAGNLHTSTNYGLPGTGTNANQNKGGFQDHYPYAAMIPAGYLPYGYPYYPPGMYQNAQMGFYPQQPVTPVSTGMAPYLTSTDTVTTTAKAIHSQPMVSQSVRLALQKKLDNTQKCYNWHYQSPGQSTRLLEPTYLDTQSKGADNNDVLSDSSTLSSPERSNSPIKPLATSSPNSNHPVGCEVPFAMGDHDKGIDNNTVRMHDLWPQPVPHEHVMAGEAFDKNNNGSSNNLNNNNMEIVVPTPYPNVAGYYNDYTPPTSSCYSHPTTTPWGNVRVNHIGNSSPSYGYKLNPDWPITTTTSADRYSSSDLAQMEDPVRSSSGGCYQFSLSDPHATITPSDYSSSQELEPVPIQLPHLSVAVSTKSCPASSPSITTDDVMTTAATGGSTGYSDISSNGGEEEEEEEEEDSDHPTCEMAPPPAPPAPPAVQFPLSPSAPGRREGSHVQQEPPKSSSGVVLATSSHAVYVLSDTE